MTDFSYEEIVAIMTGESELDILDISPKAFVEYFNDDRIGESVEAADIARNVLDELNPGALFELLKKSETDPGTFFMCWEDTWDYGELALLTYALLMDCEDEADIELRDRIAFNRFYWTTGWNTPHTAAHIARKLYHILDEIAQSGIYEVGSVKLDFLVRSLLADEEDNQIAEMVLTDKNPKYINRVKYYLALAHFLVYDGVTEVVQFLRKYPVDTSFELKDLHLLKIIEQRWQKEGRNIEWLNHKNWPRLIAKHDV